MGNSFSSQFDDERASWSQTHKLNYIQSLREEQLKLVSKFKKDLELRYRICHLYGIQYRHFWVTDGTWTIEFGGGSTGANNKIQVHSNMDDGFSTTEVRFTMTDEVKARMENVCGASNYSLALRNCEHVARYIHSGAWICFQMVGAGVLKQAFFHHMAEHTKQINIAPIELAVAEEESDKERLYAREDIEKGGAVVEYTTTKSELKSEDSKKYNILFLGPTGSGKSHLINHLFNRNVAKSDSTQDSVTKEIRFFEGCLYIGWVGGGVTNIPVNVIDTIGNSCFLCSKSTCFAHY